ncbi:MAG TPA: tetratricopeptide repeat protein [Candidatus Eisenbacteria bacterium]|nr:tetratricopeptide repeat protein [Candidatus Eisenbacteria bacterium]
MRGAGVAADARPDPAADRHYSLRETAAILEVPEARLRAVARAGLLAPQRGPIGPLTFGFQDLLLLRTTKDLLASGVPMRRIRRIWSSLREQLAAGMPLASISIRTDGEQAVATDGRSSWRPDSGQVLLDFDAGEIAARAESAAAPRALPSAAQRARPALSLVTAPGATPASAPEVDDESSPEAWYELGLDLESRSPGEAVDAYRRALALDPDMADAHVNLGRLHHLAGERGLAEVQYREAVRFAPDDPTPHFNLGVLLEEQGRRDEAIHAYQQALRRDPEFADAHCNLGLLLESMGRAQDAMRHLMSARELYRTTQ